MNPGKSLRRTATLLLVLQLLAAAGWAAEPAPLPTPVPGLENQPDQVRIIPRVAPGSDATIVTPYRFRESLQSRLNLERKKPRRYLLSPGVWPFPEFQLEQDLSLSLGL